MAHTQFQMLLQNVGSLNHSQAFFNYTYSDPWPMFIKIQVKSNQMALIWERFYVGPEAQNHWSQPSSNRYLNVLLWDKLTQVLPRTRALVLVVGWLGFPFVSSSTQKGILQTRNQNVPLVQIIVASMLILFLILIPCVLLSM